MQMKCLEWIGHGLPLFIIGETTMSSVEDRLDALESEVADLRQRIVHDADWISSVSGSMKDDPEFEEVLRLGREARKNDVPQESTDGH
jgi:hypothetical protein